ncbi:protein bric-a-brac 1-like isoform X1 [Homalodisca vitripennis]|uniref:protein bric-a-brac 1-like isoform X1 n=1 Tax=Homalodisca vitripennis TaxID=197043 RepID=UPI001EECA833|nr:protein bric-a-brac 1-like isoform X1 [Homalodisca vitripennis]
MDQQFSLRWNNYLNQLTDAFGSLRYEEDLVDVTLSCEGGKLKAHKMLLSACSSYFHDIFKENPCQHPVIVFRNVKLRDLQAILDFIYKGEVNVLQEHLESFLGTAELLEIKGLAECNEKNVTLEEEEKSSCITTKNDQRLEKVELKAGIIAPLQFQCASARSTSPPVKKRRLLSSQTKSFEGNQSEVEEETNVAPIELKIEEEEFVEEQSFEEDEEDLRLPLSPTSDPLHVPDNLQMYSSHSAILKDGKSATTPVADRIANLPNSRTRGLLAQEEPGERYDGKPHFLLKRGKRGRRCLVCLEKKIRKETVYFCKTCTKKPSLHPDICFELYHTPP